VFLKKNERNLSLTNLNNMNKKNTITINKLIKKNNNEKGKNNLTLAHPGYHVKSMTWS
jgi:hypothetical protein